MATLSQEKIKIVGPSGVKDITNAMYAGTEAIFSDRTVKSLSGTLTDKHVPSAVLVKSLIDNLTTKTTELSTRIDNVSNNVAGNVTTNIENITNTVNQSKTEINNINSEIESIKQQISTFNNIEIETVIGNINSVTNPSSRTLYFQKDDSSDETWEMFIWHEHVDPAENHWINIGNTSIELANYVSKTDITELKEMLNWSSTVENKVDTKDFTKHTSNMTMHITAEERTKWNTEYQHATYTPRSNGLYKVTVDAEGHVANVANVTKADITALGIPAADTDTHYESKNVVGANTATANTSIALSNGNVYLNSVENGKVTSSHKITGAGSTKVSTDAKGNIIITSTDTNIDTTYGDASEAEHGLMSASDKIKINTIEEGAEVNQNAFSKISVNGTIVNATDKIDNITLTGTNIDITPDATNKKLNFKISKDTVSAALGYIPPTPTNATTSTAGLLSAADKKKLDGITTSADAVSFEQSLTTGTQVGTITINGASTKLYAPTDTDTHWTTGLIVGASKTASANAAATNGNVWLNIKDNSTVRESHNIVGTGGNVTVTSDANGKISVNSTVATTGSGNAVTAVASADGTVTFTKGTVFMDKLTVTGTGNAVTAATFSGGTTTLTKGTTFVHTVSSSGSGNAVTAVSANSNGTVSVTKGTTFVHTVNTTGSGNAVTAVSNSSGTVTVTKGTTFAIGAYTLSAVTALPSSPTNGVLYFVYE